MATPPGQPGGHVARAKRTSRADARRRYRAQLAEANAAQADADTLAEAEAGDTDARADRASRGDRNTRGAGRASPGATPERGAPPQSGFRYALRAAYHPPHVRDDIAHLPELLRSRAVLIPVAVTVGTAVAIALTNGNELFSRLLAQYFLVPPPIGSIFIAGFFAKRASYLAGFIVGLVAALALIALLTVVPALGGGTQGLTGAAAPTPTSPAQASASPAASASAGASASSAASPSASASAAASPSAAASASATSSATASPSAAATPTATPTPVDTTQVAGYALLMSPLTGIFFASAAAWYRRFLQLSNPNRARAAARPNRNRPNNRRR
jgi:hypothetical protein